MVQILLLLLLLLLLLVLLVLLLLSMMILARRWPRSPCRHSCHQASANDHQRPSNRRVIRGMACVRREQRRMLRTGITHTKYYYKIPGIILYSLVRHVCSNLIFVVRNVPKKMKTKRRTGSLLFSLFGCSDYHIS